MATLVKVAEVGELSPGECTMVEANGREIALFNVDGTYFALDNTCLHRGGPLGEGYLEDEIVTCPWHGWQYNVKTGECSMNPNIKVATYPVTVEGSEIKIEV
ncbi:MAG: non-heme iron oxygenase ferredoxin subunit [Candidatus Latescibacteria bacterium]|nr:non-heme iron oxygenase ferredoxin subunit [Candidatus Latescibacterota bacterium]